MSILKYVVMVKNFYNFLTIYLIFSIANVRGKKEEEKMIIKRTDIKASCC